MQYTVKEIEDKTGLQRYKIIRILNRNGIKSIKGKKLTIEEDKLPEEIKALINKDKEIENEKIEDINNTQTDNQDTTEQDTMEEAEDEQDRDIKTLVNNSKVIRKEETIKVLKKIDKKSVIIMGKKGIGKSQFLKDLLHFLELQNTVYFEDPPTAKTLLGNILILLNEDQNVTIPDAIKRINEIETEKKIYILIDQLEKMTPSCIDTLDKLLDRPFIRFVGAGHLGGKKKYNNTWLKCHGYFLRALNREEASTLIKDQLPSIDNKTLNVIINESQRIPEKIKAYIEDYKAGVPIEEEDKYFDFTPVILVIATIGLAFRIIGSGYSSTETYVVGGVIAAIFWGCFWIYRGYVAGWWGNKKQFN